MFTAHLTDGVTADRRTVSVVVTPSHLQVLDEAGLTVDTWTLAEAYLLEEVYRGQPVRVGHRQRGEQCLTLADHAILERLSKGNRRLSAHGRTRFHVGHRAVFWMTMLVGVVVGLVLGLPYLAEPVARLVPIELEQAWGSQVAEMFGGGEEGACRAPNGEAALQKLVGRLAAVTETEYSFQVAIVRSDDVNAFAAPGGYIVIFDQLVQEADDPAEVAGVLAHEMAHVIERHPTEGVVRALGLQMIVGLLIGDVSSLAAVIGDVSEALVSRSYSRADEAEADRIAAEMLNRAGMRSTGLISFFERLDREADDPAPAWQNYLSTHPSHQERIAKLRPLVRDGEPPLDADQWAALRGICEEPEGSI
jgi:Zn-dependent protease with chaperone function